MSLLESRKLFASNIILSWVAISLASRRWYPMHSFPIPPVVVNTSHAQQPTLSSSTTASCRFHGCDRSAVAPGPCTTQH